MAKVRFSIHNKILLLVSCLVLGSIVLYLTLATQTFKLGQTELVFDLNKSAAVTLASELDVTLKAVADKLRLFALSIDKKAFKEILETDPLLVHVAVHSKDAAGIFHAANSLSQGDIQKVYAIDEDYFLSRIAAEKAVPFNSIQSRNIAVWNATLKDGPPLVGLGLLVKLKDQAGVEISEQIAIGYIKADVILKDIVSAHVSRIFVVDSSGRVLMHPQSEFMVEGRDLRRNPIVARLLAGNSSLGEMRYRDGADQYLGTYAKTGFGDIGVVSELSADKAFAGVAGLLRRSALFGLIAFTLTVLATAFFSKTLTNPLIALMQAMGKVSQGELDLTFSVKSNDEIGILSNAFNAMTRDLKSSRDALEESNRELENKVRERTRQLEEMAIKDALTGLYNRRHFNQRLTEELARARRAGTAVSIVYMDIDHFKKYNDQNGHPGGDVLLKSFASSVQAVIRREDVLARLGGEEFCVILPGTALEGACQAAEKIRAQIVSTPFPNGVKQPLGKVSCSLGVSEFPRSATDEESLIKAADDALYQAKESGRDRVVAASSLKKSA